MIWEKEFLKIVRAEYEKKKLRNPRFSIRQYATKLELSIGALSELLSGKRRLTKDRALKIIDKLQLADEEKHRLYTLMGTPQEEALLPDLPPEDLVNVQSIITDWRNFVILSVLFHPNQDSTLDHISKATNLDIPEIKERLARFKKIFPDESSLVSFQIDPLRKRQQIFSGNSLERFYSNQVDVISKSFAKPNPSHLFYTLTLCASQERYEKICEELRQTVLRFMAVEPEPNAEKIFQVSMLLFPFESN